MDNILRECRLCRATSLDFEVVGDYVYGGNDQQKFYRCRFCDVAFLFPPTDEHQEVKFYAEEFEKFMEIRNAGGDRDWTGPESHIITNNDQLLRRLPYLESAINHDGMKLLELGCSSGFMLLPLRELGLEVKGVEPSGHFTEFVQSKGIPVYESLEQFKQNDPDVGLLDLITHFFLLEHVRDPLEFLEQCLELLKPDGKVFFEVPSRDDPLVTIYNIPAFHDFYWSVAHHWYFNRESLVYLLDQLPCKYELIPEQRYDLSNHLWWAIQGKPGGMGKYSEEFTDELDKVYKESMKKTGHCDSFFVWLYK